MSPYLTTIDAVQLDVSMQKLRTPLVLSGGAITQLAMTRVTVDVTVDGRPGRGVGVIYLSDLWAWPDPARSHEDRRDAMIAASQAIADSLYALCGGQPAHPLELGLRLHHAIEPTDTPGIDPAMPPLARAVCASPFDAAIHDAVGQALGRSAFHLYDGSPALPSAAPWLGPDPAAAIRATILPGPRAKLRGWYILADPDGDPELATWVQTRGFAAFKIKTKGDIDADVARTVATYRRAAELRAHDIAITADANQAYQSADQVLAYLDALAAADPQAYAALSYLEQPTSADIVGQPQDWRAVAARVPVYVDEGLSSLDRLPTIQAQGWSGLALKTCKGHSALLVAAAWAHQHGLAITLQDLTNPAESLVQSAITAAYLPTTNGVELNSPQYTPAANQAWASAYPRLVTPHDGYHRLPPGPIPGLGGALLKV